MTAAELIATHDQRGGHLAALFRWQSGKRTQLENFCTEALASAIVSQPRLFLDLLEREALLPAGVRTADVERVRVASMSRSTPRSCSSVRPDAVSRRRGLA